MKTKFIDISELKKKPREREAEHFINQLSPEKAIEVTPTRQETTRKIARLYRKVAKTLGKEVRVITREGKVIVLLK